MAVKKGPKRVAAKAAKPVSKKPAAKGKTMASKRPADQAFEPGTSKHGRKPRPVRKADLVATVRHLIKFLQMLEVLLLKLPPSVAISPDAADYRFIESALGDIPPVDGPPCC